MRREDTKAQFPLTKHQIVSTKQGNSVTHVGLQITNYLRNQNENYGRKSYVIFPNRPTMFLH